jgi:hypothetical protein
MFGRSRVMYIDLLQMGLGEIGCEAKRRMELAGGCGWWRGLVLAVLNPWILLLESKLCGSYQTCFLIQLPEGRTQSSLTEVEREGLDGIQVEEDHLRTIMNFQIGLPGKREFMDQLSECQLIKNISLL